MKHSNEGRSCDAAVKRMEARYGKRRQDVRSPENEGHEAPVDLTCRIGDKLFAFEHTEIELFEQFIELYPAHPIIRNSFGSMTRKLSVTWSHHSCQFAGTSSRRKVSIATLNSLKVA